MQITRTARGLLASVAALTVLGVGSAHAADRTVEPLNQYVVSGRVTTDQLARAGYDLNEVKAIGKTGKLGIVATPAQAQSLRDKGATVEALSEARTMAAPPSPLTDPTHGYDVFRPWSLKPAPCPDTLHDAATCRSRSWYHDLARASGHRQGGRRSARPSSGSRSWPTRSPKDARDDARRRQAGRALRVHPARPRVDRDRGRAARCSSTCSTTRPTTRDIPHAAAQHRAVVRADRQPRRLRLHVHRQGHAPVAQEPARQQRRRRDHRPTTASTPTATGRRSGATTSRARPTTPPTRPTTAPAPASEPEVRRSRGARASASSRSS